MKEISYDVQSIFVEFNHPLLLGLCLLPYIYFYFISDMQFLQHPFWSKFFLASITASLIFVLLFHIVFRYFEFNFTKGTLTGFNLSKKIKKDDLQIDVKPDVIKVTYKNKDYHYDKDAFTAKDWDLLTSSFTRFS